MTSDPIEFFEKRSYFAAYLNECDPYWVQLIANEQILSNNTIINFNDLDLKTQNYLEKKYGLLKGQEVMSVTGPRYCFSKIFGIGCACQWYSVLGYQALGPACPRIFRFNLKENDWAENDPLFMTVEDGRIKCVEYSKIENVV